MITDKQIGANIERHRKQGGLSQKEMAAKLDMEQSSYCRIEHGEIKITATHLQRISEILEITVEDLIGEDPRSINIQHANGTQIGSGNGVHFVQHVVSEEFIREILDRFDKEIDRQDTMNNKLIELLDKKYGN
ncbi:MAG: helix-turn-helix domain-containing protein [Flavobacteriales bacterium]|jgi:transcriptional regulator with XRE-family HTH domain|nr:helix-turn-helix domain-containing protein [Flavobacteriales bacterium]